MNPPGNIIVDLSLTLGQILVSVFISTALWGMMCVQAVMYFATYKSDTWHLKSLIIAFLVLETFHEILCIQGLWNILVPKFGDILHMSAANIPLSLEPLVTGIVAALAQGFFTWRIWRFSNQKKIFPIILCPFIIFNLVFYVVIFKLDLRASVENLQSSRRFSLSLSGVITATDSLIAIILYILLRRGLSGLKESDRVLVRLMNASMTTGASTALFAFIGLITAVVWPHDYYYVLGEMPLCAVYCNAVLANLNSRRYIGSKNVVNISMDTKAPRSSLNFGTVNAGEPQQHEGSDDITLEQAQDEEHHSQAISAQS